MTATIVPTPTTLTPISSTNWGALVAATANIRGTDAEIQALTATTYAGQLASATDTHRVYFSDGTGWIKVYEPINTNTTASFTGITGGTPTYANRWRRSNGMCWFKNLVTFGGAPTPIASPTTTLPVACAGIEVNSISVSLRDAGVAAYPGMNDVLGAAGTALPFFAINTSGAAAVSLSVTATVPFAPGTGDSFAVTGWFEMNTPYL